MTWCILASIFSRWGNAALICRLSSNLYAPYAIYLPNFSVRMIWCILSSLFYGGAIRRHFAVYRPTSMPLCNLSSKIYRVRDMARIIIRISRRGNSASHCRLSANLYDTSFHFASKFYRTYDVVYFTFHISRRGNSAPLCHLSSNLFAALHFLAEFYRA